MIAYASENFVSYHVNSDSTEGQELRRRFNIRAIPTYVFVDDEGNEIDRILGFMPPDEYLAEMTRIRNGINTIPDLSQRVQEDPENVELLVMLAQKVEDASGLKVAISYWEVLFGLDAVDPTNQALAKLKIALFHSQENNDPETLASFVNVETNAEVLPQAFEALRTFYRRSGDKEAEASTYRRYVDFMFGLNRETSGFLNGYAWRMTEIDQNLENALERVSQGIDLLAEDASAREKAGIMDTKGEVLWKLGRIDEAVAIMDECILLQPEESYFKEQKEKFLASS